MVLAWAAGLNVRGRGDRLSAAKPCPAGGLESRALGQPGLVGGRALGQIGLELGLGRLEAPPPRAAIAEALGQLVAAALAEARVLGGVGGRCLGEDRLHLGADRLVGAVGPPAGVGGQLGAVEGDQPERDQAGARAQAKDVAEQLAERALVAHAEAGDRGVVGDLVGCDHAEGDVLGAAALDRPRGALADRVGVDNEREHHLRIEGGPPPAVGAVGGVEAAEVDLLDRIEHEPGQVILGQPLAQARRQEQLLIALAGQEVLGHDRLRARTPYSSRFSPTARTELRLQRQFMRQAEKGVSFRPALTVPDWNRLEEWLFRTDELRRLLRLEEARSPFQAPTGVNAISPTLPRRIGNGVRRP